MNNQNNSLSAGMLPHQEQENRDTGMASSPADDYPVLTDILSELPDLADALQNETAWNELEQRLSDRILQRIEDRIQFILEESIRQNLTDSIGRMTGMLVSEIKNDLQSTLDVVVTHAVTDELHRLRQKEFFSEGNHLKITEKNGSAN